MYKQILTSETKDYWSRARYLFAPLESGLVGMNLEGSDVRYVRILNSLEFYPSNSDEQVSARWSQLASLLGVELSPYFSQSNLLNLGPRNGGAFDAISGELSRSILVELQQLSISQAPATLLFYFMAELSQRGAPLAFSGNLQELESVRDAATDALGLMQPFPDYIWADDGSWALWTEPDLYSSYLGCSRADVANILAISGIEAFEVDAGRLLPS